jgi:DEAD/DEAH box helicase domain-containing protein
LVNLAAAIPPSPGFVIFNEANCQSDPERHLIWRRWLWLFNIFQTLPGVLLATQAGMEVSDYSAITIATGTRPVSNAQGSVHAAAWERVIEQAMGYLADGLSVLLDAGTSPPDEVGYEFEQDGDVVAEAELAWLQRKLVLLLPEHVMSAPVWQVNGWTIVVAENEWPQRLIDELGNHTVQDQIHAKGQE